MIIRLYRFWLCTKRTFYIHHWSEKHKVTNVTSAVSMQALCWAAECCLEELLNGDLHGQNETSNGWCHVPLFRQQTSWHWVDRACKTHLFFALDFYSGYMSLKCNFKSLLVNLEIGFERRVAQSVLFCAHWWRFPYFGIFTHFHVKSSVCAVVGVSSADLLLSCKFNSKQERSQHDGSNMKKISTCG